MIKRINIERLSKTSHMKGVDTLEIVGSGGPGLCPIKQSW